MTVGFFVKHKDAADFDYTTEPGMALVMMSGVLEDWMVVVQVEETDQTIASVNGQQFFDRCTVRFE